MKTTKLFLVVAFLTVSLPGQSQEEDPSVIMETPILLGELFGNNPFLTGGQGTNGFRYLEDKFFDNRNLFWQAGFYFEHIFNGDKDDGWRQLFTPEADPCFISSPSPNKGTLYWPSAGSTWGVECSMNFHLSSYFLDMIFQARPTVNVWPKGWLGFMWASYVDTAIDRRIYFWGRDPSNGQWGWCSYGDSNGLTPGGEEMIDQGIIPSIGTKELKFDPWSPNFSVHNFSDDYEGREFHTPFYYGLVDGDGDLSTTEDTMCYLMMFNQCLPIRFALFNFSGNTHRPAWDWQYIIRNPKIGKTYSYRARFAYFPWRGERKGRTDVIKEYYKWRLLLNFSR